MAELPIAETIVAKLSIHLGPNVARMVIKSFARKIGAAGGEQLTGAHVAGLIDEIRPMLNVMIGKGPADAVAADIARATAAK